MTQNPAFSSLFFNLHGFSCFILILTSIYSGNSLCIYVLLSNFILGKILNLLYFQLTYLMKICQFLSALDWLIFLFIFLIIRDLVCLYACFLSPISKKVTLSHKICSLKKLKKGKSFHITNILYLCYQDQLTNKSHLIK